MHEEKSQMNIKSNPDWDEKSPQEKRITIISLCLSFIIVIFAVLQMLGIYDKASNICVPLLGLLLLIQAMQLYKTRKVAAVLCIVCAVIIFLSSLLFVLR